MFQSGKKIFGSLLIILAIPLFLGCAKNRQQNPTEPAPQIKPDLPTESAPIEPILVEPVELAPGPGDYDFSLEHDELTRIYKVHVPSSYNKNKPASLILAFHGGLGNGEIMSEYYNFVEESDNKGFIVVFPTGANRFGDKFATWNAGLCCGHAVKSGSDDVGFVKKMLKDIKNKFSIDGKKIYATGMSNGGMFSYRLACEMSDEFAAIAAVAGAKSTTSCNPEKPMPVLHIHAVNDDRVLFKSERGPGDSIGASYIPVRETIDWWIKYNKCKDNPVRVFENSGAYCDSYGDCADNSEVKLCITSEGKHSWPGTQKPRKNADDPSQAFSATKMIWNFFEKHPIK